MSDINKIDVWHKYMNNPIPISDYECVYDWTDEIHNRVLISNSKFTTVDKKDFEYVYYTITPLQKNRYYHNGVRFSFVDSFRMERWLMMNPYAKDFLHEYERIDLLKHHANGIFNNVVEMAKNF